MAHELDKAAGQEMLRWMNSIEARLNKHELAVVSVITSISKLEETVRKLVHDNEPPPLRFA